MKNPFITFWDKLPGILKNKYALTAVAFLVYLLFFDSNDIPSQIRSKRHLAKLNKQTTYLKTQIKEGRTEYEATFSTIDQMETFAREEYMMKKEDEDLFIISVE